MAVSYSNIDSILEREEIDLLYHNIYLSQIVNILIGTFTASILIQSVPLEPLLYWLIALYIVSFFRSFLPVIYKRYNQSYFEQQTWRRIHIAGISASGVLWGISPLLFFPTEPVFQITHMLAIAGMATGALVINPASNITFFAFTLPATLPLIFYLLLNDTYPFRIYGLMSIVYLSVVANFARRIHTITREALVYKIRNKTLVDNIEKARLETEQINLELQKKIEDLTTLSIELKESEQKFRGITENLSAGIFIDSDNIFRYMNQAFMDMFQFSADQNAPGLLDIVQEEDKDLIRALQRARDILDDPYLNFEFRGVRKDGSNLYCEFYGSYIAYEGKPALIGSVFDISERKISEKEKEELIQDLNAFGHTVSHNLRNSLNVILGRAYLLSNESVIKENNKILEGVLAIHRAGKRMNGIITSLLMLAQVSYTDVVVDELDMSDCLEAAIERLADRIESSNAQITLPEYWPLAVGYAPWIEEVWFNYLSNAIKYGGTTPDIVLHSETLSDDFVRFYTTDSGLGLSKEHHSRLFQPFTRLAKEAGQAGFGLGLSIVKRIVEKQNGRVGAVSEGTGCGSSFYFDLPILKETE